MIWKPTHTGPFVHRGEWIPAKFEPLIERAHWDCIQELRIARTPPVRNPEHFLLLDLLFDEHGRTMRGKKFGLGHAYGERYYRSEPISWGRRIGLKRTMVDADKIEELTQSALKALLTDRPELIKVVLSGGLYSDQVKRDLRNGAVAARRIAVMDRARLRQLYRALIARADVNRDELTLHIWCLELVRFLAWDGNGNFQKLQCDQSTETARIHTIRVPGLTICGHPRYSLPVRPCVEQIAGERQTYLADLIREAGELRELMLTERTKSIGQLAKQRNMGPSIFGRILRLNYLAPDIQASIVDGTVPPGLTRARLLFCALPLDWSQKRQLIGFQ